MGKKRGRVKELVPTAGADRRLLRSVLATIPTESALAGVAAEATTVVFTCDNPLCIVGIKITGVPPLTFSGQQGITLPPGTRKMGWKVSSSPSGQPFRVTVTKATLDVPISGVTGPNSGGIRQLTVGGQ